MFLRLKIFDIGVKTKRETEAFFRSYILPIFLRNKTTDNNNIWIMILSPQAHPFHPVMGEDVNGIIYNDGKSRNIPSVPKKNSYPDLDLTF